jgi:hypothetical protein
MPGWVKRADREATFVTASIRFGTDKKVAVTITDISRDGCKLMCRETLPIGEVVELTVGRTKLNASVRWWTPGAAGLLFSARAPEFASSQLTKEEARDMLRSDFGASELGSSKQCNSDLCTR